MANKEFEDHKSRAIEMADWLSATISKSMNNLLNLIEPYDGWVDQIKKKQFTTEDFDLKKSVKLSELQRFTSDFFLENNDDKVIAIFNNQMQETDVILKNLLVKYSEEIGIYLKGATTAVPRIDIFSSLRSSKNLKGTSETIRAEVPSISYSVEVSKSTDGSVETSFFSKKAEDSIVSLEKMSVERILILRSNLIEVADKYCSTVHRTESTLVRLGTELIAKLNSVSKDKETEKRMNRLMESRDFNQKCLLSALKLFLEITLYDLKAIKQLVDDIDKLIVKKPSIERLKDRVKASQ